MQKYRDEVRVDVLMARGITAPEYLGDVETGLDKAIVNFARRELRDAHKLVFFFAYHCEESWEKIQTLYEQSVVREVALATIKRFGADAQRRLRDTASKSEELQHWEKEFRATKGRR